jgi:hypothetical protein
MPGRGKPFTKDDSRRHQWKKGENGNPAGLAEWAKEIARLAREHTPMVVARLAEIARNEKGLPAVRACEVLLDRCGGRPVQPISGPEGEAQLPIVILPAEDPRR